MWERYAYKNVTAEMAERAAAILAEEARFSTGIASMPVENLASSVGKKTRKSLRKYDGAVVHFGSAEALFLAGYGGVNSCMSTKAAMAAEFYRSHGVQIAVVQDKHKGVVARMLFHPAKKLRAKTYGSAHFVCDAFATHMGLACEYDGNPMVVRRTVEVAREEVRADLDGHFMHVKICPFDVPRTGRRAVARDKHWQQFYVGERNSTDLFTGQRARYAEYYLPPTKNMVTSHRVTVEDEYPEVFLDSTWSYGGTRTSEVPVAPKTNYSRPAVPDEDVWEGIEDRLMRDQRYR